MENNFKKWPHFDKADIKAVSDVLRSGKINRWTGSKNLEFEEKICESTKSKYAIALANGSLSLELALAGLGIKACDEVIVPCRTFIASASAVVMRGAKPVVVDVEFGSQTISPAAINKAISAKTKAIIAVHHAGFPCDMDAILKIARKYNLYVIEDCAQAHGAVYKGKPVGSIGDVSAWSFCQDKIITTGGEGGAVTTNSKSLWRKMWEYKDHGKSYDAVFKRKHPDGFRWLVESFGTNFRMTEMQAALGILGYKNLEKFLEIRTRNANLYKSALSKFECVNIVEVPQKSVNSYYRFCVTLRLECLKKNWNRDRIAKEISAAGVPCFSGTCWNISAEKCFKDMGWQKSKSELPNAYALKDTSLMFLTHPTITKADMKTAARVIENVLKQAQK